MKVPFTLLNWYTSHFRFPYRGLKYFKKILLLLNLSSRTYKKKIHNNLYINVTPCDHLQEQIFWYGYYEKEAILIWEKLIATDSTVIDIGANIGYYSIVAGHMAKKGKVFAFEPIAALRKKIELNCSINKLANVSIEPFAVGNQPGKCKIYISSNDNVGMSGIQPQENFSGITEDTDMISLDEWSSFHQLKKIDIIKIDTEGAELKVLQGMIKIIEQNRPAIILEVITELLSMFGHTSSEVHSLLLQLRYIPYQIINGETISKANPNQESYTLLFLPKEFRIPSTIKVENHLISMP